MSDLTPEKALEAVQNTKKIFVQIFTIVDYTEEEAKTRADQMVTVIFELAVTLLLSEKEHKGNSTVTDQVKQLTEAKDIVGVLREQFSMKEIEDALEVATQQTMSFYFKRIGPGLSHDQVKQINTLMRELQDDLGAV